MERMPSANIEEYWSKNAINRIPVYSKYTSQISLQNFLITSFENKFKKSNIFQLFLPGEKLCVDESVVKLKGKITQINRPNVF